MFKVYVHSENAYDFTDDIFKKIDRLLVNKSEVYIVTNYRGVDEILYKKYEELEFDDIYNGTEYFTFNTLDAVIFVNNCTVHEHQDLLKLAKEKNLKIRIIK